MSKRKLDRIMSSLDVIVEEPLYGSPFGALMGVFSIVDLADGKYEVALATGVISIASIYLGYRARKRRSNPNSIESSSTTSID